MTASDAAYKGRFQRMVQEKDFSSFSEVFSAFMTHVDENAFKAKLSLPPFEKAYLEAQKKNIALPDGAPAFMQKWRLPRDPTAKAHSNRPKRQKRGEGGGRGGGGRDVVGTRIMDGDGLGDVDDMDDLSDVDLLALDGGPQYALKSELITVKSGLAALKQRFKDADAERNAMKIELETLKAKKPSSDSSFANSKLDNEMRSVLSNMGSVVSILSSGFKSDEDALLKAAHCVMESTITQVETVFQWDNDRKRVVFESMKNHTPFKNALTALPQKS